MYHKGYVEALHIQLPEVLVSREIEFLKTQKASDAEKKVNSDNLRL